MFLFTSSRLQGQGPITKTQTNQTETPRVEQRRVRQRQTRTDARGQTGNTEKQQETQI